MIAVAVSGGSNIQCTLHALCKDCAKTHLVSQTKLQRSWRKWSRKNLHDVDVSGDFLNSWYFLLLQAQFSYIDDKWPRRNSKVVLFHRLSGQNTSIRWTCFLVCLQDPCSRGPSLLSAGCSTVARVTMNRSDFL